MAATPRWVAGRRQLQRVHRIALGRCDERIGVDLHGHGALPDGQRHPGSRRRHLPQPGRSEQNAKAASASRPIVRAASTTTSRLTPTPTCSAAWPVRSRPASLRLTGWSANRTRRGSRPGWGTGRVADRIGAVGIRQPLRDL